MAAYQYRLLDPKNRGFRLLNLLAISVSEPKAGPVKYVTTLDTEPRRPRPSRNSGKTPDTASTRGSSGPGRRRRIVDDRFSYDIKCELTLSHIDGNVEYEAVSYYWGDHSSPARKRTCPIQMNGQRFLVSPTFLDILVRLHDPNRDRKVWTDLICIDQANDEERGLQGSRMRETFGQDQIVIASLGPHITIAVVEISISLEMSASNRSWI